MKCPKTGPKKQQGCGYFAGHDEPCSFELHELVMMQESMLNNQEAIVANLVLAYAEIWAGMESLAARVLDNRTPEEQQEFHKTFQELRVQLLKQLQEASGRGVEGLRPDLAATMERLVPKPQGSSAS